MHFFVIKIVVPLERHLHRRELLFRLLRRSQILLRGARDSWPSPVGLGVSLRRREQANREGCDIGYVLAANSCEGVGSVDACTIAAPDVITAFAVPSPDGTSQRCRFFRVWASAGSPRRANHPAYFGLATY